MAPETSHPASRFLADMFGSSTHAAVYVCSLPNHEPEHPQAGERHLATRDPRLVDQFVRKWDRPHRGLFFCVSTVKRGSTTRNKENVAELNGLHVDIDFRSIEETAEGVEQKLRQVQLLPSKVVASGGGLHAYWLFKEALEATPQNIARVETLLGLLADHLGGDPNVCHAASLMRLVGTHNTKQDSWTEVGLIADRPLRYELDELEDWLTVTVIRRRPKLAHTNGTQCNPDPWLAAARRLGFKPQVDVEQRLAAMRYQGDGDAGIHATQISVSAALLCRGEPVDEIVGRLLDATRAAAGRYGQRWNWAREERAIRQMCEDWMEKHPELRHPVAALTPENGNEHSESANGGIQRSENGHTSAIEGDPDPRAKTRNGKGGTPGRKPKRAIAPQEMPTIIVKGVVDVVRQSGGDLLLTDGELYLYGEGVWRLADSRDEQRLKVLIQQGADALGAGAMLGIINAAWKRLSEHPPLYREHVKWDPGSLVAVANGTLDLRTRKLRDWKANDFVRRKLDVVYDPSKDAPGAIEFLETLFAEREPTTRAEIMDLLQEFCGASLAVRLLKREQRRVLILLGPSRTGKTELARLIGRLVGKPIASPSIAQLAERFGPSSLYGASAWISDDAINEGDKLDPQRFKNVVTGEAIELDRKQRDCVRVELDIPVVLTTNALPGARDSSDAVFNRCLVIDMVNVISEEAAELGKSGAGMPEDARWYADWLFEREGSGILNWALDGLERLLRRGRFEIPIPVAAAIQGFKDSSTPVGEWARTMLVRTSGTKIERGDLLCAFQGWWRQEMGDDVRLLGGRWLFPKFRVACPWATEIIVRGVRHFGGVALVGEGLKLWSYQNESANRGGRGAKGTASSAEAVNRPWDGNTDDAEDQQTQRRSANVAAPRF